MARYVPNPGWESDFRRRVTVAGQKRLEAMKVDAVAAARPKSARWAEAIQASTFKPTGMQSFSGSLGLNTSRKAFPGWWKERGTGARTRKSGGSTGSSPADPVFVPLAEKWRGIPFTY